MCVAQIGQFCFVLYEENKIVVNIFVFPVLYAELCIQWLIQRPLLQFFTSLAALEWCIRLEILVAILDIQKMRYQIFCNFLSHFCMHFDFSLIFQALSKRHKMAGVPFFLVIFTWKRRKCSFQMWRNIEIDFCVFRDPFSWRNPQSSCHRAYVSNVWRRFYLLNRCR